MDNQVTAIANKIIEYSKNKVLINFKFFALAMFHTRMEELPLIEAAASSKFQLYYNPEHIIDLYKAGIEEVNHLYLHMMLHLLFHHAYFLKGMDIDLWGLACDIVVEGIILDLNSYLFASKKEKERISFIQELKDNKIEFVAEAVYKYLLKKSLSQNSLELLIAAFSYDSHVLWLEAEEKCDSKDDDKNDDSDKGEDNNTDSSNESEDNNTDSSNESEDTNTDSSNEGEDTNTADSAEGNSEEVSYDSITKSQEALEQNLDQWKDIASRIGAELSMTSTYGSEVGNLAKNLEIATNDVIDYASFLSAFGKIHDVMRINDDEFDYVFYTFGLNTYKNIPIVEPLEYKDEKTIANFVIAIDTSGSTIISIVKDFLSKTYVILRNIVDAKKKVCLHIIQADACVQRDDLITSLDELEEFINHFVLVGGGGTDFRPVFQYVDEKINKREYPKINGLIYFTDGYGKYPTDKPSYKTAFVFLREYPVDIEAPAWAYKMVIKENGENL